MTVKQFIDQHQNDDIRQLALRYSGRQTVFEDGDLSFALDQIAGRQAARRKLPSWYECDGITYPPHISMEQCSSEETAVYKQSVIGGIHKNGVRPHFYSMVDLTGGFGVDFSFLSRCFEKAVYVERQEHLCRVAEKNFKALGLDNVSVVNGDAVAYLEEMEESTLIFMDPARRSASGGRTYALGDCTPNVLEMIDLMLRKAQWVMLKLSPMLDWHKTVHDLGEDRVSQVHIVSVGGECKELLVLLGEECEGYEVIMVNGGQEYRWRPDVAGEVCSSTNPGNSICSVDPASHAFLFEPNASVMKGGCFDALCSDFGVAKVAPNSHLFVAEGDRENFPGRRFRIDGSCSMNKKELRQMLAAAGKANIAVRNFPLTAEQLRKKLKLSDGGDRYIFGTTLSDGSHRLFLCSKL